MKKASKIILCITLICASLFGFSACSETGGPGASAVAIGLGHGSAYPTIIEVQVILGGGGTVKKVQFDEIFCPDMASYVSAAKNNETTSCNNRNYYNYLSIGGKIFEFFTTKSSDGKDVPNYKGIGDAADITDLFDYSSKNDAGRQWYYDSVIDGKAYYAKENGGNFETVSFLTTTYGSIRKRYSSYWNTQTGAQNSGLTLKGNMESLENYLLEYGFDSLDDMGNIINPEGGEKYVKIKQPDGNTVITGATLNKDANLYLTVAKKAYDEARRLQTGG